MPLITLTTEWKPDDFYYGILKGRLCSLCPTASIIVNAGNIDAFDMAHASFVIRNTYQSYPEGTVHIICIHSEATKARDHLIVSARGHYFIGTDNGIFNLILNTEPDEIIKITSGDITDELEIFARAAAGLCNGTNPSQMGSKATSLVEKVPLRATIEKDVVSGSIIFIDSYGNAISNITREVFYRVFENRPFKILVQSNRNYTYRIAQKYSDVPVGELLARFNQLDLLEVAVNGANVSELLSITTGSVIRVDALNNTASPNSLL